MADRRLPFSVHDDAGEARQGEILILRSWQSDVKPNPAAAFTIVLSEQPLPEGETPQRFVEIVQAADVAAMTRVLDDDLLTFLDELLSQPLSPTADALAVFEELVRAHPSVSGDDVDGVAETLRRLLTEQLEAQRPADPTGTATFRLATEPLARL